MTPESPVSLRPFPFSSPALRRIGAAIAEQLHAAGMNTVLHYRTSRESAQILCDTLNDRRPNSAALCAGSLENAAACESLAQSAVSAFGELHALVNNASAFFPTPMGKTTDVEWDALFDVNLRAPFFCHRLVLLSLQRIRAASLTSRTFTPKGRSPTTRYIQPAKQVCYRSRVRSRGN